MTARKPLLRALSLLLSLLMLLSVTACGESDEENPTDARLVQTGDMDSPVYMCPMMLVDGNISLSSYLKKHKKNAQKSPDTVFEGKIK